MKVYVLTKRWDYDDFDVWGVYTSKEAAEGEIDQYLNVITRGPRKGQRRSKEVPLRWLSGHYRGGFAISEEEVLSV